MTEHPLTDIDSIQDEMEQLFGEDKCERDGDTVTFSYSGAELQIRPGSHVSARMPLHSFEIDNADTITFDHESDTVTITADGIEYRFTKP